MTARRRLPAEKRRAPGFLASFPIATALISVLGLAPGLHAAAAPPAHLSAADILLAQDPGAVRFAVIGDSGTGDTAQRTLAARLVEAHRAYPFDFVLMLGDNIYGSEKPRDFFKKFEVPYGPLLAAGVRFYAALGNHDKPNQRLYKPFNMDGKRYYTFQPDGQSVRFFALDSNYMDPEQIDWLKRELKGSNSAWKIAFFHHPIYSSGKRHGPDLALRSMLEGVFVESGVDLVLAGHEHFYERLRPQNGIVHIISGSAAKLRRGGVGASPQTAKAYDQGLQFVLASIRGDDLDFQVINERGKTVDSGRLRRRERGGLADGQGEVEVIPGLKREAATTPSAKPLAEKASEATAGRSH